MTCICEQLNPQSKLTCKLKCRTSIYVLSKNRSLAFTHVRLEQIADRNANQSADRFAKSVQLADRFAESVDQNADRFAESAQLAD